MMIDLKNLPDIKDVGQETYDNVVELNRVYSNIKQLVQALIDNGNDVEDIAKICWHSGFEYATFYYIKTKQLKLKNKKL